jgi:predicted dehydrogenase
LAADPNYSLVAIVDIDPARQNCAAEIFPGVAVFSRIEQVLALANVEAVTIATPPLSLFGLTKKAIAAGRHVFVEKPGAATAAEALAMADAAQRARKVLFVDMTPVWSPLQEAMAAALAAGTAGQLVSWRAERTNLNHGQPGIDVLRDLAVHDLAVLDALVAARPAAIALADAIHGVDGRLISARMRLTYADGFVADIVASWVGEENRRRTTIVGTKGTLLRDDVNAADGLRFRAHPGLSECAASLDEVYPVASSMEPLARALEGFGRCVRIGAPPQTDAFAAARVLDWIAAAERTYREGRPPARAGSFSS